MRVYQYRLFSMSSASLSGNAGIPYDLASQQSKISFAIQRKRETGLPSFGEKLKQEREKRKISLEQISSSTKIGTRMLQALEEDKFNQLPGGIFNKGFVRAYSRCIGLDEDQTVAEYLQASGDAPPPKTEIGGHEDGERENEQNIRRLEAISDAPARPLPWGLLAALLLVLALALSFWSHRERERTRQSVRPAPTTATARSPGAAGGVASGGANEGVTGVTKEESGARSPTSASPTNASPANASPTGAPSVAPKTPPDLIAAAPAATPGEFTVVIHAREDSWVSITADGKTFSSELLGAGSERSVQGRKEIMVRAGNSGGIDFRFNGKKLDTGGTSGEVKTVTFGPGGMLPSAPSPPSTP
jgi:cytoskeleton protein RodZ